MVLYEIFSCIIFIGVNYSQPGIPDKCGLTVPLSFVIILFFFFFCYHISHFNVLCTLNVWLVSLRTKEETQESKTKWNMRSQLKMGVYVCVCVGGASINIVLLDVILYFSILLTFTHPPAAVAAILFFTSHFFRCWWCWRFTAMVPSLGNNNSSWRLLQSAMIDIYLDRKMEYCCRRASSSLKVELEASRVRDKAYSLGDYMKFILICLASVLAPWKRWDRVCGRLSFVLRLNMGRQYNSYRRIVFSG